MNDRIFLAEFLLKQRQASQGVGRPLQNVQATSGQLLGSAPSGVSDENVGLVNALKTVSGSAGGLTPLPELNAREALAKSLLEQSQDRDRHPLARGIAAFFGAKAMQDIGAEKGKTQQAIQAAEAERKRLEREENLALKQKELDIDGS